MEPCDESRKNTPSEELVSVILDSLDSEESGEALARRACYSLPHFHRLFRAVVEENPGQMRRRLLLERAAYQLGRTPLSVTEIAFDAQYGSLEGFTHAFRKAFGVSPSHYRRLGATYYGLPTKNGIHFYAQGSQQKEEGNMDLFDLFAGADSWHLRRMLEKARNLTDAQLDAPLPTQPQVLCWEEPEKSLRDLLERMIFTKEVWTAALTGGEIPENTDHTIDGLRARFEAVDGEFNRVLREVRDTGRWSDTFVDALCEPPEKFTFGGMFAHVVTFNTHRRLMALDAMRRFGMDDLGFGDPMEWESSVATPA